MGWEQIDQIQGLAPDADDWVPVGSIRGPAGPPGPPGPPGGGVFVHDQTSPAATWTIAHGLGRKPHAVSIFIDGQPVLTDTTADDTHVVVEFPSPETGEAHIL
jgi:hypothetical protein